MSNKEWIDLIVKHEETIIDKIIECDKWNINYQVDILLYSDGTVCFFDNVGGNSFRKGKNVDYITICSIDNEYCEEDKEQIDSHNYVEWAESLLEMKIFNLKNDF